MCAAIEALGSDAAKSDVAFVTPVSNGRTGRHIGREKDRLIEDTLTEALARHGSETSAAMSGLP